MRLFKSKRESSEEIVEHLKGMKARAEAIRLRAGADPSLAGRLSDWMVESDFAHLIEEPGPVAPPEAMAPPPGATDAEPLAALPFVEQPEPAAPPQAEQVAIEAFADSHRSGNNGGDAEAIGAESAADHPIDAEEEAALAAALESYLATHPAVPDQGAEAVLTDAASDEDAA